jgi:DNA (cytosine-5)-methyltransferase 1
MAKRVVSLFTGIGGFEIGLSAFGFEPTMLCEIDPAATAVLNARFEGVDLEADITQLGDLPDCEILVAGWPCQDLSQAGKTAGREGSQSGLIGEIFRLLDKTVRKPPVVLLENVAFALSLNGGSAIRHVTSALEDRGYRWAYRVLDTRHFGLPQRRRRIFICGALDQDPRSILMDGIDAGVAADPLPTEIGFYCTEGNRGVGWTPDAVPPLKGGSSLSIPSPPAIWQRESGLFVTPGIEDAERLQGFQSGWTASATQLASGDRARWRLVGNAVSVPVTTWIAGHVSTDIEYAYPKDLVTHAGATHNAAFGGPNQESVYLRQTHEGPRLGNRRSLAQFGLRDPKPLSNRAASGFLSRYMKSKLAINTDFLDALTAYCG